MKRSLQKTQQLAFLVYFLSVYQLLPCTATPQNVVFFSLVVFPSIFSFFHPFIFLQMNGGHVLVVPCLLGPEQEEFDFFLPYSRINTEQCSGAWTQALSPQGEEVEGLVQQSAWVNVVVQQLQKSIFSRIWRMLVDNCGLKPLPPSDRLIPFHNLMSFPWGKERAREMYFRIASCLLCLQ